MAVAREDREMTVEAEATTRRCVVCGNAMARESLIRFVVDPEDRLTPDILEELPGRGHWVCARRESLETAIRRNCFNRSARKNVSVAPDLVARVEALLTKRCIDLIALARRAGQAVAGFEKVRSWLLEGRAGLVVAAADGADGSRDKIAAAARGCPVLDVMSAAELAVAFGRARAVHVALRGGGLMERLLTDGERLRGFRTPAGQWSGA